MVCSLLFCYSMFDLETNINSTCHDHQLSIDNALNLFDVMNFSHVEKLMDKKEKAITLHAFGDTTNYTLVIFLDSPTKRMVALEGVDEPVSYRACYHSRLTTPWVKAGLIYFIMCHCHSDSLGYKHMSKTTLVIIPTTTTTRSMGAIFCRL